MTQGRPQVAAASRRAPTKANAWRPLVLLVEDEVLIRCLLAETLRADGYRVVEAANAAEALDVLEVAPDVAVLVTHVKMPGPLDGLALAARVRADHRAVKVIVTSGHAEDADGVADVFLAKPFDLDQLARRLHALAAPAA